MQEEQSVNTASVTTVSTRPASSSDVRSVHMLFPTAASSSRPHSLANSLKGSCKLSRSISAPFSSQSDNVIPLKSPAVIGASCVTCAHSSGIPDCPLPESPAASCASAGTPAAATQNSMAARQASRFQILRE